MSLQVSIIPSYNLKLISCQNYLQMFWILIAIVVSDTGKIVQVNLKSQVINVHVGQQFKLMSKTTIPYLYLQQIDPNVCFFSADQVVPKIISYQFLNFNQKKTPLYRIEDLFYDRPEVDSIIFGDVIVSIDQRHKLTIIKYSNKGLEQMQVFNLVTQKHVQLTNGHFIISQNSLLFFTHNYAFIVNIQSGNMTYLKGYNPNPQYQYSVVSPNGKYIFVANGKTGMDIYSFSENELTLLHNLMFQGKEVMDIEVDYHQKNYFYVMTKESIHIFRFNFDHEQFKPPEEKAQFYIPYYCENFFVLKNKYIVANCIDQGYSILFEMWINQKDVEKTMVRSLSFMRVKDLKVTNEFIFVHGDSYHLILRSNIFYFYPENYEKVGELHFSHLQRILNIPKYTNQFVFIGRQSVAIINLKEQYPYHRCQFFTDQKKQITLTSYGRCLTSNENCKYIENVIVNVKSGWLFRIKYLVWGLGFVVLMSLIGLGIIYKKKKEYRRLMNENTLTFKEFDQKESERVGTGQMLQQIKLPEK